MHNKGAQHNNTKVLQYETYINLLIYTQILKLITYRLVTILVIKLLAILVH